MLASFDLAGAAGDELDQRGVVERRLVVGQQHQRGDAAHRGGGAGARQGLLVLLAGLAGVDARIDQARREIEAAAVDRLDAVGRARGEQVGPEVGDLAVADQHGAAILRVARRIDDAGVDVGGRSAVLRRAARRRCRSRGGSRRSALRRPPISASRQAMRTATPISTCSWMTERSRSSATSRVDLDAAVHRAGMHDQCVGLGELELLVVEPEEVEIFADRGHEQALHALGLQAQHHDDVDVLQAVFML